MKNRLSWACASQLLGNSLTTEERAAGWPEAFAPEILVRLQYPREGSAEEKKQAVRNQRALYGVMTEAMNAGSLPTVERTRMVVEYKEEPRFRVSRVDPALFLGSSAWHARDAQPHMARVETGKRPVAVRMIEARVFRACLLECGKEPSAHIAAWFDAAAGTALPVRIKKPTKQALFLSLLEHVEEAWRNSGRGEINKNEWPGLSKDLCVLAGRLMPEAFGSMPPEGFYENYAKKAGLRFGGEGGVAAIYAELFPAGRAALRGAEAA